MLGVCLPECLPLCCSEGGRGWACSCLGRAAPARDTAGSSLWLQSHDFTSVVHLTVKVSTGHRLEGEDPGSLALKVAWLGNGRGWR